MILGCVDQTDLATASTSAVCMPSVCTYLLLSCSFPSFDLHEVCGVWVIIIFKCNIYRESPLRPSDVEHHNRVIHFPAWSFRLSQFPFHTSSECWRGICFPDCLWSWRHSRAWRQLEKALKPNWVFLVGFSAALGSCMHGCNAQYRDCAGVYQKGGGGGHAISVGTWCVSVYHHEGVSGMNLPSCVK